MKRDSIARLAKFLQDVFLVACTVYVLVAAAEPRGGTSQTLTTMSSAQPLSLPIANQVPPPPGAPPSPPAGLRASTVNQDTIRLDRTPTSSDESGYHVNGDGGFFPVPAGLTTLNAGGLSPDTRYCFWITAYNAFGESPPSNEACATTAPAAKNADIDHQQ